MKRIFASSMSIGGPTPSRERVAGAAVVVFIHAAFLYAFITGMAQHVVREIPRLLEVQFIPHTEHAPPPPLPPELPKVDIASAPQVAPPVIRIERPSPRHTIRAVQVPVPVTTPTQAPVADAPPAAAQPPAPPVSIAAAGIAGTHTVPPYPALARRLSEEGTVRLRIALDDTGAISDVVILKSSGHERLDIAAREWVKARWRYRPATRNGVPVTSSTVADIVFNLRNN
ncbi:MAG TPA: energy transducer TonB [Rhizomicrobium sp.]|nr:energy transducer TonB [Rhizomicrobium sp.]